MAEIMYGHPAMDLLVCPPRPVCSTALCEEAGQYQTLLALCELSEPGHGVERQGCTMKRGSHETQTVSEPCAHILDPSSHRWRTS